jgi:hypothetical protein
MYSEAQAKGAAGGESGGSSDDGTSSSGSDDVIDAEYEVKEDKS